MRFMTLTQDCTTSGSDHGDNHEHGFSCHLVNNQLTKFSSYQDCALPCS